MLEYLQPKFMDIPIVRTFSFAPGASLLKGRWVVANAAGVAAYPTGITTGVAGAYILTDGTIEAHKDIWTAAADYSASTPYAPLASAIIAGRFVAPPMQNSPMGRISGVNGILRLMVGSEGIDPALAASTPASYANGASLKLDAVGRLVPGTVGTDVITAYSEGLTNGVLTFKTTGI